MIELPLETQLVLASGSPRRCDLLRSLGLEFEVRPSDVDESIHEGERPERYVLRLSSEKALTGAGSDVIAVGADTTVELGGVVLGKPTDDDDARRMLGQLSGRTHRVHTGVTVTGWTHVVRSLVSTDVVFTELTPELIEWYVATGEPMDKAGSYAIQGAGGALVARIDGSVSNVVGLPLAETLDLLRTVIAARPS
jgi:septum formation protein